VKNNIIKTKKRIIVAPLNWGLGHATRCIPIINALINHGFEPVICSDGDALLLLQKEFSKLKSYKLPSYHIQYTKNGNLLKYRLLLDSVNIINAIKKEQLFIERIVQKENIKGIISDNRFGVRSNKIPSVYLTHQINVLSGSTSFITSKIHQSVIAKFDECWIPDHNDEPSLSGKLSHLKDTNLCLKYIGPLSRFDPKIPKNSLKNGITIPKKKYDVMVLLSGPEPQRTILEEKLESEFKSYHKKVLFIRGKVSDKQEIYQKDNIFFVNYMLQYDLQKAINESEIVITRSGYSTIMDFEKLNTKAFFIPTPGQFEQEYLAKYLKQNGYTDYCDQETFHLGKLDNSSHYEGFKHKKTSKNNLNRSLFDVFN